MFGRPHSGVALRDYNARVVATDHPKSAHVHYNNINLVITA